MKESDFRGTPLRARTYLLQEIPHGIYMYARSIERGIHALQSFPPQTFSFIAFMLAWRVLLLAGAVIAVILSLWWYKRSRDVRAV